MWTFFLQKIINPICFYIFGSELYFSKTFNITIMSLWRVLLCIIFPPLAIMDKGCGSVIIVFLLTLCGWIPGVIAALIINNKK